MIRNEELMKSFGGMEWEIQRLRDELERLRKSNDENKDTLRNE